MNTEFFIAKRVLRDKKNRSSLARPIINLAVFAIALSLAVMIISVGVVTGFKKEIRNRIIGFGSHIQILNFDSNNSYESIPVSKNQFFIPLLDQITEIDHIQVFATKPGIIKTETDIQGVIVKGIGSDYKWDFFKQNIKEGNIFIVNDSVTTDKVLISKYIADLLKLNTGDKFAMYFIDNKSRPRGYPFIVSGIFETSLEIFDKQFVFADISRIQKINEWTDNEISGFEILLNNFKKTENTAIIVKILTNHIFYNAYPAVIEIKDNKRGVVLKFLENNYDTNFFKLTEGKGFSGDDRVNGNAVIISRDISTTLNMNAGDTVKMNLINNKFKPVTHSFIIRGIYKNTNINTIDKLFVIADQSFIQKLNESYDYRLAGFEIIRNNNEKNQILQNIVKNIRFPFFLGDTNKLSVISIKEKNSHIFQWLSLLDMNVWIILGLMLLVAIVNMISGLLILILDRIKMIGILKAIGTNNKSIRNIFIYKSVFIVIKGLFWGNMIGIGICVIQKYFRLMKLDQSSYFIDYVPINIHIPYFVLLNILTLIIILCSLLLPSMLISNISPVKTIRYN